MKRDTEYLMERARQISQFARQDEWIAAEIRVAIAGLDRAAKCVPGDQDRIDFFWRRLLDLANRQGQLKRDWLRFNET